MSAILETSAAAEDCGELFGLQVRLGDVFPSRDRTEKCCLPTLHPSRLLELSPLLSEILVKPSWQHIEGASLALMTILRKFEWIRLHQSFCIRNFSLVFQNLSSSSPSSSSEVRVDEDETTNACVCLGSYYFSSLPPFIQVEAIYPAFVRLLGHAQLSVRDAVKRCFWSLLARSDFEVGFSLSILFEPFPSSFFAA